MPTIFDHLWQDYTQLNLQASVIHQLLADRDESVVNDHIALRTFQHPNVGIDVLAAPFVTLGYEPKGEYHFSEKKLYAKHYEHPSPQWPKVFISELLTSEFSPHLQQTVTSLVDAVDPAAPRSAEFLRSGIHWSPITSAEYERLREESEYAAWMTAFGFRPNHFTVFVNALDSFESLVDLNEFLKAQGFALNAAGGEIKGSPAVLLEQSSTLAAPVTVGFADQTREIPGCYYEFAYRYPLPDGSLYQGFVAQSADKIFESTDNKREDS